MRAFLFVLLCFCALCSGRQAEGTWWKGNLHTHSLWSDGDDYPEMIAQWYKERGYHFLALSDHNILSNQERWISLRASRGGALAFDRYLERFGSDWVETRELETGKEVRLKMLSEFRGRFEEKGKFLMIQSEEITAKTLHVNVTNIQELILPYTAFDQADSASVVRALQRTIDTVLEQRQRTGVPMFPHINHPNYRWALTAEELVQIDNERFFELYNGHTEVRNEGDETHASTERAWDIILTLRLGRLGKEPIFALATDDSHQYHNQPFKRKRPGRGWVMVRAPSLTVEHLIAALEAGDFYASSGVILKDVRRAEGRLALEIDAEPGVTYTTEFIGTFKDYDETSEPVLGEKGEPLRVTRRYSAELGQVLASSSGPSASYVLKGDEIYVRARVTSSKLKADPYEVDEVERAWTQPLIGAREQNREEAPEIAVEECGRK